MTRDERARLVECRVPELRAAVLGLAQGLERLAREAGPAFVVARNDEGELVLLRRGALVGTTRSADALLGALEVELDAEVPRLLAGRCVFHAAAAGAVLVVGESRAGKSTLVTALVARGLAYLTDDGAVVEEDGSVTPYPRRIGLRPGGLALLGPPGQRFVRLSYELDDRPRIEYLVPTAEATATAPARVQVLAFLEREGTTYGERPLSAAEATARLLVHARQTDDPGRDLRRALRLVASAPARRVVTGGSPSAIAEALLKLLGEPVVA